MDIVLADKCGIKCRAYVRCEERAYFLLFSGPKDPGRPWPMAAFAGSGRGTLLVWMSVSRMAHLHVEEKEGWHVEVASVHSHHSKAVHVGQDDERRS